MEKSPGKKEEKSPSKKEENQRLSGVMDMVITLRQQAREQKDWTTSDMIRDGLAKAGIQIKDNKEKSFEINNKIN